MRRILLFLGGGLLVVLVAAQLALPSFLSGRIEDRLTEDGGQAEVTLRAVPALRLLASDGERIEIRGRGLRIDLTRPTRDAFERLDGFGEVDVRLDELIAGPFAVGRFELRREDGSDTYRLQVAASTSGRDLAAWAASQAAGPLGGLVAGLAGGVAPGGDQNVPIALDAELRSVDGRARVESGEGTVAGLPAGPLAELMAEAILSRL